MIEPNRWRVVEAGRNVHTLLLAILLALPGSSWANEVSVGNASITIPSPSGFSPVTPQMASLSERQKQFVGHGMEELAAFIPERDVPAALNDDLSDLPRRFAVQAVKGLIGVTVSTAQFVELKSTHKSQHEELMKNIDQRVAGLVERANEELATKSDEDRGSSISQMVFLPIHLESDCTVAYSSLVKYQTMDESGDPATHVAVVTITLVHVKGTVLLLHSYAEESGLEWSRQASREWADSVVAANPSERQALPNQGVPSAVSEMDWWRVVVTGIGGAIVGVTICVIWWAARRVKGRASSRR